jgi:nicotinamidase-related amidase
MQSTPAVIVVDMVNDNVHGPEHAFIASAARALIPGINRLLEAAHERGWTVVFAGDSFRRDDFYFTGIAAGAAPREGLRGSRLKPHAIEGTRGAEVVAELRRDTRDLVLPKRRMSAFFGTGLERTLRAGGVDTVLVCGIATPFCVLTTTLDALCHDFRAVIVEDCCAAARPGEHEAVLGCYRSSALHPLLRVLPLDEALEAALQ